MPAPNDGYRPIPIALPEDGVFVFESRHRLGFSMPVERHEFLELFYVLDGAGTFDLGQRTRPCAPGDLVAVPAGTPHRIDDEAGSPLSLYGIAIAPSVWSCEPGLFDHVPPGRLPVGRLLAAKVRADLKRLLFEQMSAEAGSRTLI